MLLEVGWWLSTQSLGDCAFGCTYFSRQDIAPQSSNASRIAFCHVYLGLFTMRAGYPVCEWLTMRRFVGSCRPREYPQRMCSSRAALRSGFLWQLSEEIGRHRAIGSRLLPAWEVFNLHEAQGHSCVANGPPFGFMLRVFGELFFS